MIYFFSVQAKFTGGEDGIQAVPRGTLLGVFDLQNTHTMYFAVLAIFLLGFLVVYRAIHSPFGQVLKAIRENEPRAVSLGYRAERRSEEHTSELQSLAYLVCRLLLE